MGGAARGTFLRHNAARAYRSSERSTTTDSKLLGRTPAFLGVLILLYTLGTGLTLSQSVEQVEAAALRSHSVAGVVGTILCFVGMAIVIRQSRQAD